MVAVTQRGTRGILLLLVFLVTAAAIEVRSVLVAALISALLLYRNVGVTPPGYRGQPELIGVATTPALAAPIASRNTSRRTPVTDDPRGIPATRRACATGAAEESSLLNDQWSAGREVPKRLHRSASSKTSDAPRRI